MSDAACGLCGKLESEHQAMQHGFSLTGELFDRVEQEKPRPSARIVSTIDLPLRMLLISKGLITGEDLILKEGQLRDQLEEARRNAADHSD